MRQFDDPVVARLLDPAFVAVAASPPLFAQLLAALPPGTYGAQVMRTRYLDDVVVAMAEAGVEQVAILGAGLDTRAYRLAALASAVVFEVDLPAIQRRKRRALSGVSVAAREVRFVPVDLGAADLGQALAAAGLNAGRPALFVCEGVTQYLPEQAVRAMLGVVAGAAAGSTLAFTYVRRSLVGADAGEWSSGPLSGLQATEPWVFGLDPGEVPAFLAEAGLRLVDDVGDADYQRRYLRPIGRELVVGHLERAAVAVV
jgi:methyltransferase (TIGR00027 family)